jgi:acetyltransferase-like isoleucine patch superfamily enzyme
MEAKSGKSKYFRVLWDLRFCETLALKLRYFVSSLLAEHETRLQSIADQKSFKLVSSGSPALRLRKDIFVSNYEHLRVAPNAEISSEVRIVFPPENPGDSNTLITLGKETFVGRRVELGVLSGNQLTVGDYSSIQDNCVILGDVCIERYCTLSLNIFISSGNHYSTLFPTWLIRDQDAWVQKTPDYSSKHSRPVHIEEDCWLGWGAFVRQGIYIGRGAVIGAYTVVTRDVPPYSIQVGAPNREIGRRLDFRPPQELQAMNENHRPYFYAGFLMKQDDIAASTQQNILFAKSTVRLVLQGGNFDLLSISGRLIGQVEELELTVLCNKLFLGDISIKQRCFAERLEVNRRRWQEAAEANRSTVMQEHNEIELRVKTSKRSDAAPSILDEDCYYGISAVSVSSTEDNQPRVAAGQSLA